MILIDGKKVAAELREELKKEVIFHLKNFLVYLKIPYCSLRWVFYKIEDYFPI